MTRAMLAAAMVMALAVVAVAPPGRADADGIGYFPSDLTVANGLRGQRYPTGSVLVNQTAQDRQFRLSGDGDIGGWLTFATEDEPETLTREVIAKANSQLRLIVYVNIPASAANGTYRGEVLSENFPMAGQESEVVPAFRQGVTVTVTGTQTLRLQVGQSAANDAEVGKPVRIETEVGNLSNVAVAPAVAVSVQRVTNGVIGETVGKARAAGDTIEPGQDATVSSRWDSSDQAAGQYMATVTVSAQGKDFGQRTVNFRLVEPGSLGRQAKISSMAVVGSPKPGQIVRIDVTFQNAGEAEVTGKFVGEVYGGDSVLAETESKVDATAQPKGQATISTFFPIKEKGDYTLRGRVTFEGGQSEESALSFRIAGPGGTAGAWLPLGIGVAAISVTGGAAGFWLRRKGAKRAAAVPRNLRSGSRLKPNHRS